ncbi:MAG: rhodanese-like domain-containing protein [Candidatus Korobacteraceae bacterium]|jgi:phage shock protein E
MNWTIALVIAIALAVIVVPSLVGRISLEDAHEHLKNGALVIDVRSPGEFNAAHLPNAINVPLGEIESALPRRVRDKNQALLMYCHSGMRSGMAKKKLKRLGYTNVFNLGSYARAARIVIGV